MLQPIIPLMHPWSPPFNDDANYTITLQQVCEILTNKYGEHFDKLSEAAREQLFNFTYQFWSENEDLKREFETDFLRHFFMREIGYETVALFRLKLEDAFKVWMPYYSRLMQAAIKAADLDWTLTDDYWIDYYSDSTIDRNITDNNETINSGRDTRTSNQTGENTGNVNDTRKNEQNGHESQHDNDKRVNEQIVNSQTITNDTKTIDQNGERHGTSNNNRTHGGSDTNVASGSTAHSYEKAVVDTDTPQDRFTQGGSVQQLAIDVLDVKMDYATDVKREKYVGNDTDNNRQTLTNYNSTINDVGENDENTSNKSTDTFNGNNNANTNINGTDTEDRNSDRFSTLNGNETLDRKTVQNSTVNGTETMERGTKVNYTGAKNDNHHSATHQSTHEAGRRGVAWIDIYDKYMKAIRNIEDEIFRRFDVMLFMQIWG